MLYISGIEVDAISLLCSTKLKVLLSFAGTSAPDWVPGKWSWSWPRLFSSPSPPEIEPESETTPLRTRTSLSPQPTRSEKEPLNDESSRQGKDLSMPFTTLQPPLSSDIIHQLLANPALYDPIRTPRFPIILSHGTIIPHSSSSTLIFYQVYTALTRGDQSHSQV